MSRREDVQNTIWDDEPFASLSPNGKLLYLWSFTNQKCNMAGLYRVRVETMTVETGMKGEDVLAALRELDGAGMACYERGTLWVRARIKRLTSKSPNMKKAIRRALDEFVPGEPLRERCIKENADLAWLAGTLPEPFLNGFPISDSDAVSGNPSERVLTTETETGVRGTEQINTRVARIQAAFQRSGRAIDEVSVLNAIQAFPSVDAEQAAFNCAEYLRDKPDRPSGRTFLRFLENDAKRIAEDRKRDEHKPQPSAMVPDRKVCRGDGCDNQPQVGDAYCRPCRNAILAGLTGEQVA